MKKLRIAQIAPPQQSVPPKKYGGIELVVHQLTETLAKIGHEVFLLASTDSKTSGTLVPVYEKTLIQSSRKEDQPELEALKAIGISNILKNLAGLNVDIVHHHWSCRLNPFFDFIKAPVITTVHYNLNSEDIRASYKHFKDCNYVSISHSQRKGMPDLHYVGNVYHGINADAIPFSEKKEDYFAFLGRIFPDKGPKEAILAAKQAGVVLKMAARIDRGQGEAYFEKEIRPLIDGEQIQFIGEIGFQEKNELLKNARGLIAPIQWEEPFGLTFIEAMACGTPVAAFNRGSIPEIIKDKKTGFICKANDMECLAESVKTLAKMPANLYRDMSLACRARVQAHFTAEKMAEAYEKIYYQLLGH